VTGAPAAVVTGAARGLGRAIAEALSTAGYRVHLSDVDEAVLDSAARLGATGHVPYVRDEAACAALASTVDGLALWVNNAGVLVTGPVWTHMPRPAAACSRSTRPARPCTRRASTRCYARQAAKGRWRV
jgi:NAD(P)-dependent dehydrogenase (short-subunit alcohol dehydrogenase family)